MSANQQPLQINDGPLLAAMSRSGGVAALLAIFGIAQLAMVALGYSLKESTSALTVIWPPPGLSMVVMWLTPRRYWPAFLGLQFFAEYAVGSLWVGRPGAFRERRWALPMGPEDLACSSDGQLLWTVTEHPRRRWILSIALRQMMPEVTVVPRT